MSNGKIDDAEIDALLTGDQRLVDRYLVTGIRELKHGQADTKAEVEAMRKVCETRGLMCPGAHANLADPVDDRQVARQLASATAQTAHELASEAAQTAQALSETTYQTRTMWGVGISLLERVVLPVLVVVATLAITGKL